jgi:uncharacterized membrane protein YfcA
MSVLLMAALAAIVAATSFLSGIFGMAGGLVLMGILLAIMPVPEAMAFHGVTQLTSNGWRALLWWRHIRLRAAAYYLLGAAFAFLAWSVTAYVPDKPIAMLLLGVTPFAVRLLPQSAQPNPMNLKDGIIYGAICMTLILLTGVVGPLIDTFFLGGKLDRREIVATKSFCQIAGHAAKLVYFMAIAAQASVDPTMMAIAVVASIVGTTVARRILEAMSDTTYRKWSWHLITAVSTFYVLSGFYLLALPMLKSV